ncbi:MAG: SIS domain-containing protein [Planctomycetota bacterium]
MPATAFFDRLCRLLQQTRVTDRAGAELGLDDAAEQAVNRLLAVRDAGRTVIGVGNGGSHSIVAHLEMDLCNRAGIPALTFNHPAILTALANDHGYDCAFARLIRLKARPGDCLVAVSSSGQSENILQAVRAAQDAGASVLTFSGFEPDNPLRARGDLNFYVPASEYGEVEVAHQAVIHYLSDCAVHRAETPAASEPAPQSSPALDPVILAKTPRTPQTPQPLSTRV